MLLAASIEDLWFYDYSNCMSVISSHWKGENAGLCEWTPAKSVFGAMLYLEQKFALYKCSIAT